MIPKKAKGKVYGAVLTAAERKAMDIEIRRQYAEYTRKHSLEIDSIILWLLHDRYGFGPERLKGFHDEFISAMDELAARYEMEDSDNAWLCTQKLKEYGIDIEQWEKEKGEEQWLKTNTLV